MKSPEFPHNLRWFNSEPLLIRNLQGSKVVLVDFWTYSCVNCIRTLPHLKKWHETYAPHGLVIVGVHTPEFDFEKEAANVERALKVFQITYPVVLDNDYQIWSLYSSNFWPNKFLINKDGRNIYNHAGEGAYAETEEAIQKALLELNPGVALPAIADAEQGSGGVCLPVTPETYLGSLRGRPGKTWSVSGIWKVYPEFTEHERNTRDFEDYLELRFEASEVNLVMGSKTDAPVNVRLELNGKVLKDIEVHEPKMYNLIEGPTMLKGTLKIFAKETGLRAYAFTFGSVCAAQ